MPDDYIKVKDNVRVAIEEKNLTGKEVSPAPVTPEIETKAKVSSRLKLILHPRRQKLQPITNGIDFLGYIIRHNYTLVRHRVLNNFKARMRYFENLIRNNNGRLNAVIFDRLRDTIKSYLGHFKWANTYRLMQLIYRKPIMISYLNYKGV
jgi:hypothetical protein